MKILLFIILSTSLAFSQTFKTIQIDSKSLDKNKEIQIFLPEGYESSTKQYPTLYVLDGQTYFYYGVGFQQAFKWRDRAPEFIVVGINSKDWGERRIDFKSKKYELKFRNFIEHDLFTYINKNYRTNNDRMIFGWEDTGDFILNILFDKPELFSAYFVASAIKWNNKILDLFTSKSFEQEKYLYFGLSPSEQWATERFNAFSEALKQKTPHNLRWNVNTLTKEDHWSTPYQVIYNGIKNYYTPYVPISFDSYEDYKDAGGYQNVVDIYKKYGLKYGLSSEIHFRTKINLLRIAMRADDYKEFTFLIKELDYFLKDYIRDFRYVNYGDFYLKYGNTKAAFKLLEKGVKDYPWSARVFNCYGDVYKAMGDIKNARLNYTKAIELATEYSQRGLEAFKENLQSVQN
ncbi:MAG: tetratricopeptide repeat protein [Flavobacteriaceae bacterium]|nr:tetratricopeptide repeat protein [Flavobacteriaceae bacterium]